MGDKSEFSPSKKEIAKIAKCSERSVGLFIQENDNVCFCHDRRWDASTKKNKSNKYYMDPICAETVILLDYNSLYHNWDKVGKDVVKKLIEDDHFLCSKTVKKWQLSTDKLPTAFMLKLPTLNSYLNSFLDKGTLKKCTHPKSKNQEREDKKKNKILDGIPLSHENRLRLGMLCAPIDLKEAVLDYNKYVHTWGKTVQSPYWFLQKQADKSFLRRMK